VSLQSNGDWIGRLSLRRAGEAKCDSQGDGGEGRPAGNFRGSLSEWHSFPFFLFVCVWQDCLHPQSGKGWLSIPLTQKFLSIIFI
jgi:hypothetical protein